MRKGGLRLPIVALVLAGLAQLGASIDALPWPSVASSTLAGLFLLVAVTRIARDAGVRGQQHTPHAVAGVAMTGALWYAGAAVLLARPALGGLAALHVLAAALAFAPAVAEKARDERAWLIGACTSAAVSLVAVGALPREAGVPGAATLPSLLAIMMLFGAWFLGTGRMIGLLLAASAGTLTLVLSARVLSHLSSTGDLAAGMPLQLAPVLLATAALGAAPAVIAMALRLEAMWKVLAPGASTTLRQVLVWGTLPALAAVAVLLF